MCVCPVVIEREGEGRREERRGKESQICTCRKWGGPWTEPVTSDDTTRPGRQTTTPTTRSQPPRALALPSTHTPDTHTDSNNVAATHLSPAHDISRASTDRPQPHRRRHPRWITAILLHNRPQRRRPRTRKPLRPTRRLALWCEARRAVRE